MRGYRSYHQNKTHTYSVKNFKFTQRARQSTPPSAKPQHRMKRTRPTTSDGSRKKQRSSGREKAVEIAQKICTDEEYAICLKVLSQVNAATTEQMIQSKTTLEIFLNKIQTTAPNYAMNLTTKLSNASQLVASPFWNGTTTNSEIIAVLKSNRDDAFHYDAETS